MQKEYTLKRVGSMRVEKYKRVPVESGVGLATIWTGTEDILYEVTLESAGVARMVKKAARNQSNKSCFGPVCVRIIGREPIVEAR